MTQFTQISVEFEFSNVTIEFSAILKATGT